MRRTFFKLVTGYAEQNGIICDVKEGECQTSFTVAGLQLHLGLIEASGMLIIQTGVGILPDEHREAFLTDLLTANNLFSRTMGLTLGVDKEMELVTLQLAWEMGHLDAARFENLMGNVLAQAAVWLQLLGEWEVAAASATEHGAPADTSSLLFLKI